MALPTLNEIAYTAYNTVRNRGVSNDLLSIDQIKFLAKSIRAQLIKQDSNKGYTADSFIIQDLGCVELELVDRGQCCDVQTGCTILRTKLAIPSTIELHRAQLLTRVGPIDRSKPSFNFVPYERVPFIGYNQFTKNMIYAFFQNNDARIYFVVPDHIKNLLSYVNIQGVFEDPTEAAIFYSCEDTVPCYTDNTPWPIKAWMMPVLIEMIVKSFIGPQTQQGSDNSNNAKTDVEPTKVPE